MVTVKWPEPSHHPTDKVTYYWLQSCCRDASKHGGKCFQPLPPATVLSQQWDVNCMHDGGQDRWGTACLCVCVINSQDGGQLIALGVFGANNGESNHQLSHRLRRFLLEY